MSKKLLYSGFVAALIGVAGLVWHDMSSMDIDELVLCSANEGGIKIPSRLCTHYMTNYRIDEDDIEQLSKGAGLEFILNLENPEKYKMAEIFISRGLDVNSINHYNDKDITPLHAAVLYNDLERVRFLINQGANINIESKGYGMTALELARKLHKEHGKENRSEIVKILSATAST